MSGRLVDAFWGRGWSVCGSRSSGRHCRFAAKYLEHDHAARRTFPFDRFSSVLHHFFNALGDFFLRFALNTISFSHKIGLDDTASGNVGRSPYTLRAVCCQRQLVKVCFFHKWLAGSDIWFDSPDKLQTCFRSSVLRTFPVTLRGKAGKKTILRGTL